MCGVPGGKASIMVQSSWLKPTWHLKSSKQQDFPCLIHGTNMDNTRVLCWTLTVVLPLQPGHLAKSCTIFASKSLRIPRKLSWVSAALAKPQVVVHLSTLRCTNLDRIWTMYTVGWFCTCELKFIQIYKYIFFGSQMTGLMGCDNVDCTWTKEVKRLHMKKVMRERCEGRRVE